MAVLTSPQMLAPSDVTVKNTKAVTQQPPYIITYCTNTTHPLCHPPPKKICIKHIKTSGNHMCNAFLSRPTCLSRTAMTPGLTQICLLEENSAARMAYHTNAQCCPRLLSFQHINNDPQQFGNSHFQYKIHPVMLHFTCDIRLLATIN